jgi:hypothetical protein
MDSFVSVPRRLPRLQVRLGKLQKIGNQSKQKHVDIFAGDSDLVPAIEAARDSGVVVTLYYSPNSRHEELLQAGDLMETQVAPTRRARKDGNPESNCQIRRNGDS